MSILFNLECIPYHFFILRRQNTRYFNAWMNGCRAMKNSTRYCGFQAAARFIIILHISITCLSLEIRATIPVNVIEQNIINVCENLLVDSKSIELNNNIRFWHERKDVGIEMNIVTFSSFKNEKQALEAIERVKRSAQKLKGLTEWWVVSKARPQVMSVLLKRHGFCLQRKFSVMVYDCEKKQKQRPVILPPAILIKHLTDTSQIYDWDAIIAEASGRSWPSSLARINKLTLALHDTSMAHNKKEYYASYYNNQLAGTGCFLIMNGYGFIYNIATDSKFRRKGLAKSLMSTLICRAQELKLKYILLLTNKNSIAEKLYVHLGFENKYDIKVYALSGNS